MTTTQAIVRHLEALPEKVRREVLDFVEYLEWKTKAGGERATDEDWASFSLESAMRGMEGEDSPYELADVKDSAE